MAVPARTGITDRSWLKHVQEHSSRVTVFAVAGAGVGSPSDDHPPVRRLPILRLDGRSFEEFLLPCDYMFSVVVRGKSAVSLV